MRDSNTPATKLLLVDDQPGNIDLLRRYLGREDFTLAAATNGEAALKIARRFKPDLILLDVMMPGIDGFETCRRLKADPTTRSVPVIFVTAKIQPEDIEHGFTCGAADYVCKPVQEQELLVRVNNQLMLKRARELQLVRLQEVEMLAQLGHLVGTLSHEVATPLSNVQLALSSLEDRLAPVQRDVRAATLEHGELERFLDHTHESLTLARNGLSLAINLIQRFKAVAVDQCADNHYRVRLKAYLEKVITSLRPRLKLTRVSVDLIGPEAFEFSRRRLRHRLRAPVTHLRALLHDANRSRRQRSRTEHRAVAGLRQARRQDRLRQYTRAGSAFQNTTANGKGNRVNRGRLATTRASGASRHLLPEGEGKATRLAALP